jgi:hypothetical protein
MKIAVGRLRELFRQGMEEAKVGASAEYMKKERVREAFQQVIAGMVAVGEVNDEKELQDLFKAASISLTALKMIPFDVWKKLPTK